MASALMLTGGLALAADKKDEKKPDDKSKPADPKKAPDAKTAEKDAKPATNAVPLVVEFPKSVFLTAVDAGKDPFFPTSKRRFPKPPKVDPPKVPVVPPTATNPVVVTNPVVIAKGPDSVIPTPPVVPPPPPPPPPVLEGSANLSLRGISGSKSGFLVTIHSGVKAYFFRKGDEQLIRLPNDKQLKLRCLDINERSARFGVDGEKEPRELFLREGL